MPKESQPGKATGVLPRPVALGENPANHVSVDLDLKRQGNLLSDSRTAPVGITNRGEQHAVLLLAHSFVKAKQFRRLQNDCGTEQTSRTYQERHQAGEDAVRRA